ILSTRAGVARPVRRPRSSSRKTLVAFSMRSSASNKISSLVITRFPSPVPLRTEHVPFYSALGTMLFAHHRADRMAGDGSFDVPVALEVKDQDGQFALSAQANGGHIHHP